MAILSILGAGAWTGLSAALRATEKTRSAAKESATLIQLDDRFRSAAARVRPPWWDTTLDMTNSSGTWQVPYLDGEKERTLAIAFHDGTVRIDDGAYASEHAPFASARVEAMRDAKGTVFGLELRLKDERGRDVSMTARLGGFPLRGSEAP